MAASSKFGYYYTLTKVIFITLWHSITSMLQMWRGGKETFYAESIRWADKLIKAAKIDLQVLGAENLDPAHRYIYCSNHASLFDIPILLSALRDKLRFVYKKELEKIPVFGYMLKKSPFISVKREEGRSSMAGIEEAIQAVNSGASIIIFPEGTRSKTGELGEFKRGAFLMASRASKAIVPVTVAGSAKIMPAGTYQFQPGIVRVIIDKPIPYEGERSKAEEKELMANVYSTILSRLRQYDKS